MLAKVLCVVSFVLLIAILYRQTEQDPIRIEQFTGHYSNDDDNENKHKHVRETINEYLGKGDEVVFRVKEVDNDTCDKPSECQTPAPSCTPKPKGCTEKPNCPTQAPSQAPSQAPAPLVPPPAPPSQAPAPPSQAPAPPSQAPAPLVPPPAPPSQAPAPLVPPPAPPSQVPHHGNHHGNHQGNSSHQGNSQGNSQGNMNQAFHLGNSAVHVPVPASSMSGVASNAIDIAHVLRDMKDIRILEKDIEERIIAGKYKNPFHGIENISKLKKMYGDDFLGNVLKRYRASDDEPDDLVLQRIQHQKNMNLEKDLRDLSMKKSSLGSSLPVSPTPSALGASRDPVPLSTPSPSKLSQAPLPTAPQASPDVSLGASHGSTPGSTLGSTLGSSGGACKAISENVTADWCNQTVSPDSPPLGTNYPSMCKCDGSIGPSPTPSPDTPTPSPDTPTPAPGAPSPAPSPSPDTPTPSTNIKGKFIGGWVAGTTRGNAFARGGTLLPGNFGFGNPTNYGTPQGLSKQKAKNIIFTIGGATVSQQMDGDVESNADAIGATGICYDAEGYLTNTSANQMAAKYKSKYPTQILCPRGDQGQAASISNAIGGGTGNFTHVAPMLYWGEKSYQNPPWTKDYINGALKEWNKFWTKEKVILTFQSQSAAADDQGQAVLKYLVDKLSEGYAGLLGWPSANPGDDEKNIDFILKHAGGSGSPTPTPGTPTPAPLSPTPSTGTPTPSGPAGTNYQGDKTHGDCLNNHYSKAQCPGQFSTCAQKYAFPYYYYDTYLDRVAKKPNVPPQQLQSQAISHAQGVCDSSPAKTYQELGSPPEVTWSQIASIFKANNPSNSKDCANSLIVAAGECQPNNSTYTGCISNITLWQNPTGGKLNPDESAKNIYTGTNYSKDYLCADSPDKVPDGFISAGNSNWLGPFCHVNTWKTGFGWGGGQCTGGIGGNSGNGGNGDNGGGSGTSSGTNSGVNTGSMKCGMTWKDAHTNKANRKSCSGQDSDCPDGQYCYANV